MDCKQGQRTGHDEHSRDLTHCSSNSGRHPASIPGGLLGTVATTVLGALGSRTDGCRQRSVGARKAPLLLLLLDHVPIGGFRNIRRTSGEPLNAAFLGVLEIGMERLRAVVGKMVTELQIDHGVDLKLISATVSGQADSDLGAWERDYSEAPDVIARRMTAKQIEAELCKYIQPDGWPQGVAYPTLPIDLQRHHDHSQIKPHWTKPLNSWTKTQLGQDKKRLTHLLAAARQIFYREHPDRRPGAPSVAQAAAQRVQRGVLHNHLNAVPLLRGLKGEVCATAAVGGQKLF